MKRKFLFLSIILLVVFSLTSCIDYVQSISYKDGKYHFYNKITFSKLLLEMVYEDVDDFMEEFDDEFEVPTDEDWSDFFATEDDYSDEDIDDFMEEFDDEFISSLPSFLSVKPVNTDIEVGAEISFSINPKEAPEEENSILPKISGNKYFIPFMFAEEFSSGDFDDYEDDEIAIALFSSAKCRVMISKKIIPSIDVAFFEGRGSQNFAIPVFDYGESFCLEIPFIIFFESDMYEFDRIVILKES